jgi:uncharacterized protein
MADPFDIWREGDEPIEPRSEFRTTLRERLRATLEGAIMQPSWLYYVTIPSNDLDRTKRFYSTMFPNWVVELNDAGTGFHVDNVQPPMGASVGIGEHPMIWFVVDDLDAAVGRVRANGGTVGEPIHYPSGLSVDCRDDQGMHFSLSLPGYPSAPVASTSPGELFYFNLSVHDDERGKQFYSSVFGWEFGNYTGMHVVNTAPEGGLGGLHKGEHPEIWYRVADLRASMALVESLGGAAEFVGEGEEGSHAWCTDDQGFGFGISQPSAQPSTQPST